MWADSKRSDRMVIDLINTVRHSDTESSNINLQILYGCHEEWCSRVWKTLHTGMSFALKVEHRLHTQETTRSRRSGRRCSAL